MSLYDDLGVAPDASLDAINAAYRRQAKAAHPDRGGEAGAFERLGHAVAVLRDPARRAEYDRTGAEDAAPREGLHEAEALAQFFIQALSMACDPTHQDVIRAMDRLIAQQINEQAKQIALAQVERGKIEDAQTRLRLHAADQATDGAVPNILAKVLADRLSATIASIGEMERREELLATVRTMAGGYEWMVDAPPPYNPEPQTVRGFTFFGGGGSIS